MKLDKSKISDLKYKLDSNLYKADFIKHAKEKDPISLVYPYTNNLDKEVVAFIVSTLSYGRQEIFRPVLRTILNNIGDKPAKFIANGDEDDFKNALADFTQYRFNTKDDLVSLFKALKTVYSVGSTLEEVFLQGFDGNVKPALSHLVEKLLNTQPKTKGFSYLLPSPDAGSCCKRLNMFLRWMVRIDLIDIGLWSSNIPRECLIVPLDIHIAKVSRELGLTTRISNTWSTAEDITESLRCLDPKDPIKYDFALCTSSILKNKYE
jgi:uncharacterized protein (TIGR02757 family)